ncbi:MAG: DNA helicase II [Thiohalomonadales bacterium]
MDVSHILDELNAVQRDAVCTQAPNLLVLAGAGSGKTRVLVHRIAWLVQTAGVSPHAILAVTFTNKTAAEMRQRVESLLQIPVSNLWIGTFHSLAHRLLRLHWKDAELPQNFQILDSDDQLRSIKRVTRSLDLDETKWPPKQTQWFINGRKDEGQRAQNIDPSDDPYQRQMLQIYQHYQEYCERAGLVDFAELLLRAHELWLKNPTLLAHYQHRFRHVLVDEFQDTNSIQYAWIRVLAGKNASVFAVGDDDQSIYGWRGARIENIQTFDQDFANTQIVRLEQNYRSSGNILAAANALIAHNEGRLGKKLWTADSDGEPIKLYHAFNEQDEARFIVDQISDWINNGGQHNEAALLYRSNAQSRVLEEALLYAAIPYRVYGGLRFFDRAEIKDVLAYVRLVVNPQDDTAFERVVNTPTRGIGDKTLGILRQHAREQSCSLTTAMHACLKNTGLTKRATNALQNFLNLIGQLSQQSEGLQLFEVIEHVMQQSGLYDYYDRDKSERGQGKLENLDELVNAARYFEFEQGSEQEEIDEVSAFLSHAALESGDVQKVDAKECVQLMTLHSAKGLEFPLVFLCGVEEGLFPHQRSVQEQGRLEEERRLCYVGITRAKRQLCITHAQSRRMFGTESFPRPSRFIAEIPPELIQEVRLESKSHSPMYYESPDLAQCAAEFHLGQRVHHAKFGDGVVLNYDGQGQNARIQINFDKVGSKWLMVSYANLEMG